MKTITLDDEAYQRLLAWKQAKGDSFSKVVKRVVPEAGTLGALAQFAMRRTPSGEQDAILEATVEERSSGKHDPWI
ncbi:MAG TPA: antitoxin VapB family protein [Verrucomicrobiales bacterium]|nr:antitoxin VapB family protein [Verrucomicrobiales bacterium]